MPTEKVALLVRRWMRARKDWEKRRAVARELHSLGITHILQFTYQLQLAWADANRGGFNHEVDELALFLEPGSPVFVLQLRAHQPKG